MQAAVEVEVNVIEVDQVNAQVVEINHKKKYIKVLKNWLNKLRKRN